MKKIVIGGIVCCLLVFAVVSLLPEKPVIIPAGLAYEQRADHRRLEFAGIHNFRDLGGYPTEDGRRVKWGVLYRSGTLHGASDADLEYLQQLGLHTLVDFRSSAEKEAEPDHLPEQHDFSVVEIPTLDGGDNAEAHEIMDRVASGDFSGFDPQEFMLEANRDFASSFTPQYREFLQVVTAAEGQPVLWHCTAGKDRAGFAAAILLRILGVPEDVVVQDYALSKQYSLAARRNQLLLLRVFKGKEAADKLSVILGVEPEWLEAGFAEIEVQYGSFENYVREGLGLSNEDVTDLRSALLEQG
ncbi:MAG: tyrosine-protein phosphatase [Halieaceae bacterium]|nr:tyrosine-protein phosphatase [Halieaceae bacterium]